MNIPDQEKTHKKKLGIIINIFILMGISNNPGVSPSLYWFNPKHVGRKIIFRKLCRFIQCLGLH